MNEKTIVEINGVKLEIDMRHARRVDNFKVGDNIKVLIKNYGDSYSSHPGVIVGFDNFENLPTIIIAYLEVGYNSALVKFEYLNSKTKDVEICHMNSHENLLDKHKAVDYLDREIIRAEIALNELKNRKNFFLEHYGMIFENK